MACSAGRCWRYCCLPLLALLPPLLLLRVQLGQLARVAIVSRPVPWCSCCGGFRLRSCQHLNRPCVGLGRFARCQLLTLFPALLPLPPCRYLSADVDLDGVAGLREALKQQGTKVRGPAAWYADAVIRGSGLQRNLLKQQGTKARTACCLVC